MRAASPFARLVAHAKIVKNRPLRSVYLSGKATVVREADAPGEPKTQSPRLEADAVAALYREYAEELRCFLLGVLCSLELANEVLQITFAKTVEQGHTAQAESVKGWLFRVAYNEAMTL